MAAGAPTWRRSPGKPHEPSRRLLPGAPPTHTTGSQPAPLPQEPVMILRRHFLMGAGLAAGALSAPTVLRAQERTIKMGALRLIHSMPPHFYERFAPAGTKIEIITFDSRPMARTPSSPSRSISAPSASPRHPRRRRGEPVVVVGAFSNKGMGVISKAAPTCAPSRISRASASASGRARPRRSSSWSACAWRASPSAT